MPVLQANNNRSLGRPNKQINTCCFSFRRPISGTLHYEPAVLDSTNQRAILFYLNYDQWSSNSFVREFPLAAEGPIIIFVKIFFSTIYCLYNKIFLLCIEVKINCLAFNRILNVLLNSILPVYLTF